MIDLAVWQREVYSHYMGYPIAGQRTRRQLKLLVAQLPGLHKQYGSADIRLHCVALQWLVDQYAAASDSPKPVTLDALDDEAAVIELIAGSAEIHKQVMKRTRQGRDLAADRTKPDHAITAWYAKNSHKYHNKKEAASAFAQLHGGNVEQLYNQLRNDQKKHNHKGNL